MKPQHLLIILISVLSNCDYSFKIAENCCTNRPIFSDTIKNALIDDYSFDDIYENDLFELLEEHPEQIFSAFYSIPEYRNICKYFTCNEHDFPLLTPDLFSKSLDTALKCVLLDSINSFIIKSNNYGRHLKRIENWCLCKREFNSITQSNNYSIDFLMDELYSNKCFKHIFFNILKENQGPESLTSSQMDMIFYEAINELSKLSKESKDTCIKRIHFFFNLE